MGSTINKLIGTLVPIVAIIVLAVVFLPSILSKLSSFKADQTKANADAQAQIQSQQHLQSQGFLGSIADGIFGLGTADSIRTSLGFGTPSNPSNAGSTTTPDKTVATDKTATPTPTQSTGNVFSDFYNFITGNSGAKLTPSGETVKSDNTIAPDKASTPDTTKIVSDTQNSSFDTNSIVRSASDTAKALSDFLNLPNNKVINSIPNAKNVIPNASGGATITSPTKSSAQPSTKPIKRDPFDSSVQL